MNKSKAASILGISENASDSEIKTAYKKMAIKFHPDKNKDPSAEEKFKEISTAYNYLLNPQQEHQQHHFNPFEHFAGFGGFNPFDGFGGFEANSFVHNENKIIQCQNTVYKVNIKLKDAHSGLTKNFKISIKKRCFDCREKCNTCNGSGKIVTQRQIGPMTQHITNMCNLCRGSGKIRKDASTYTCGTCQNKQEWDEDKKVEVVIPKCVKSGYQIIMKGLGEQPIQNEKDIPGDLIFEIIVDNSDDHFTRRNDDLIYKINIDLKSSIVGKILQIPHYESLINIDIKTLGIINPKKEYYLMNLGLGLKGKLVLQFNVDYPEISLNDEQVLLFEKAFESLKL